MNRFFWLSLLILASINVAFAQDGPRVTASPLRKSLNLSDLPSAESARDNMGLPDNVEQCTSVASLGINVFTGKQTMTQSVSKSATLWHGHFENTGTGPGSYLGVYLASPNRYGYIRGFDYDYSSFGLADSIEFGGSTYGAVRLHQSLATGVVGIMFGNGLPYTAVATWTSDGVFQNSGDIIANSVNVVDGVSTSAAHIAATTGIHGAPADTRFLTASETIAVAQIPTGTSGTKVPLLNGANTWSATQTMSGLVVDTNTLYVDEGQNRVGVGTTTPGVSFDVYDNSGYPVIRAISGSSGQFPIYQIFDGRAGGRNWAIENGRIPGFFQIRDNTAAQPRVTINDTGYVGIGTTTPSRFMTIYEGDSPRIQLANDSTGGTTVDGLQIQLIATSAYIGIEDAGDLQFQTSATTRMKMTSAGNVGIGTTTPTVGFQTVGTTAPCFDVSNRGFFFHGNYTPGATNPGTATIFIVNLADANDSCYASMKIVGCDSNLTGAEAWTCDTIIYNSSGVIKSVATISEAVTIGTPIVDMDNPTLTWVATGTNVALQIYMSEPAAGYAIRGEASGYHIDNIWHY